jgi:hypothetical protein
MSNLDDFFKKRDKKKKVAKSKFSTVDTDDFAKRLEATAIADGEIDDTNYNNTGFDSTNIETTLTTQQQQQQTTTTTTTSTKAQKDTVDNEFQDEEWKPFDSDENKDYSGLRIKIEHW